MLIPKPDIRIISRKITLANGAEALAYFAVLDMQGVFEIKFLGTKLIHADAVFNTTFSTVPKETVLLLENAKTQFFGETPIRSIYKVFSPFYTLDFLTSQLARAPSFK
ncbi:MAG: hypothetical protein AAB484_01870 [Patescibacteria group bacterium]